MEHDAASLGPIDLALVEFRDGSFDGTIVTALADLVDRGVVAILDLLLVRKTADGSIEVVELSDAEKVVADHFAELDGEVMWLLSAEDVSAAANTLEPSSIGVLIVWENLWARSLRAAVASAGGRLVIHDRLDADEVAAAIESSTGG